MPEQHVCRTALLVAGFIFTQTCSFSPVLPHKTLKTCKEASSSALSGNGQAKDDEDRGRLLPWLESPVEDERRPTRKSSWLQPDKAYFNDWRIERYDHPEPLFPDTIDSLTDAAWDAVAGTLYGKQRLDPNIASNAMSTSIYGYRPVRNDRDVGRIGIEIDGAKFLFHPNAESSGTAIRRVALQLGAKLCAGPWEGFEESGPDSRPVAIYFNTIKQTLIASQEMLLLKRIALEETGSSRCYDNITILCLHENNEIPMHMHQTKRKKGGLIKGAVDPTQGIVLVVQPTDYNTEFRPPGPAIGVVGALQQLVARASVNGLPVIIISPRFLAHEHHASVGWDQSGYQRSSVFGGAEPPKGPTPWLMRDFTPPVFAWVGCALSLSAHHQGPHHVGLKDDHGNAFHHSRVVGTQSVMQEDHAWHLFAVKEYDADVKDVSKEEVDDTTYQYLASTKTSSGRPPRDIIRHIFNEWS